MRRNARTGVSRHSRDFLFANVANFFVSLGQQMLIATLPVYIISLGGTPAQAGLVTGAAAVTALLARPVAGYLVDAWRRRPVSCSAASSTRSPASPTC